MWKTKVGSSENASYFSRFANLFDCFFVSKQSQQSSVIQTVKKDLFQMKGQLQTNHLRLAGIQSEMVRWASHKCTDENKESIQNIRIATLEQTFLSKQEENDERPS